jgi:glycosyltransferase involved in cell wall biosynthesis
MTLVGIVATLRSWKGHRHLIEAVARLVKDAAVPIGSDPIGLVIVGDGPQHEALAAQAATLGLPAFWMPGNQTDVVPWLHALDIFDAAFHLGEDLLGAQVTQLDHRVDVGFERVDAEVAGIRQHVDDARLELAQARGRDEAQRGRATGQFDRIEPTHPGRDR